MGKQLETVTIIIDDKGNPEISVVGASGASCLRATKSLEEALGTVVSRKETSEMSRRDPKVFETTKVGG